MMLKIFHSLIVVGKVSLRFKFLALVFIKPMKLKEKFVVLMRIKHVVYCIKVVCGLIILHQELQLMTQT